MGYCYGFLDFFLLLKKSPKNKCVRHAILHNQMYAHFASINKIHKSENLKLSTSLPAYGKTVVLPLHFYSLWHGVTFKGIEPTFFCNFLFRVYIYIFSFLSQSPHMLNNVYIVDQGP